LIVVLEVRTYGYRLHMYTIVLFSKELRNVALTNAHRDLARPSLVCRFSVHVKSELGLVIAAIANSEVVLNPLGKRCNVTVVVSFLLHRHQGRYIRTHTAHTDCRVPNEAIFVRSFVCELLGTRSLKVQFPVTQLMPILHSALSGHATLDRIATEMSGVGAPYVLPPDII
jgi:hypothetical protein